jgi:FkbM family methyltransferase
MAEQVQSVSRRKGVLRRLGRHVRDLMIGTFPLELGTERGLVLPIRNRSELSVYHNIFVQRVYRLDAFTSELGPLDEPTVFDAGANTGQFAAAVFDRWPRARVHAFEPQEDLIRRIHEFAALNGLENRFVVNWVAIGRRAGIQEFYQNRNPISASLIKQKAARRTIRRVVRVSVTTLDEYAQAHSIDRVDILKLDVEGVELDTLNSATRVLKDVRLLFLEVHPPLSTFGEAARILQKSGLVCVAPVPPPEDTVQANCVFARRAA